jgi:formate dehydrogenase major subunit
MDGYTWPERRQIESFQQLKDDGTTACGGWLYCGVYPEDRDNRARARRPDGPDGPGTHLGWAWAWPAKRRICTIAPRQTNRAALGPSASG